MGTDHISFYESSSEDGVTDFESLSGSPIAQNAALLALVVLSCPPIEVHGPHLPTMADIRHADGLIERTADILSGLHPEIGLVRLPWMWTAADVLPHVGSIKLKASTVALALS